jgi:hypothetical protein
VSGDGQLALDGPIGAPDHHRVVFENEHVRVIEAVIPAGDTVPLHTHLVPHLIIVTSGSQFVRRAADGTVLLDTRDEGDDARMPPFIWTDGIPAHTLENVGPDDIVTMAVELKS